MNYNQDPWSWVDQQKPVAPLGASLQPSQEQPPPIQVTQDPTMQQLTAMGVGKLAEGAAQGITSGIKAYGATSAPLATTPAASTIGTAAAEGLAASGIPGVLPAAASTVPGALATGAAVPAATTAAGTAASAGLGTAAAAGGEAALAAMGPIGWAIGAGLLAKKLGIF